MTDATTRLDAIAGELAERDQLRRRAELVAAGRRDSVTGHRQMIDRLTFVLALSPVLRPTFDAAPGDIGRPSEQWESVVAAQEQRELARIPEQREPDPPALNSVAEEMDRRRELRRQRDLGRPDRPRP